MCHSTCHCPIPALSKQWDNQRLNSSIRTTSNLSGHRQKWVLPIQEQMESKLDSLNRRNHPITPSRPTVMCNHSCLTWEWLMRSPPTLKSMSINYHTQPYTTSRLKGQAPAISSYGTCQPPKDVMIALPLARQSSLQRRLKCLVNTIMTFFQHYKNLFEAQTRQARIS